MMTDEERSARLENSFLLLTELARKAGVRPDMSNGSLDRAEEIVKQLLLKYKRMEKPG
jgi:hypothetical protein